jgi:hypothetical protein
MLTSVLREIPFQNGAGNQEFHDRKAAQMKANDMGFRMI